MTIVPAGELGSPAIARPAGRAWLPTWPAAERAGWTALAARPAVLIDCGLVGAIVLGAVALRLSNLMIVPRLSDETHEVLLGLRIARGEVFPLVGVNTYIGALFSYLIAAAFHLVGPRPEVGRLTVLMFGALGVIPTYLLARRLGGPGSRGRAAGLMAALLIACSPTDILVTSRIAYSNSLTPFFTTFGLWLLHRAVTCRSGRSLAASGLLFGLALQTHASALAIWPGLALYLLLHRRRIGMGWLLLAGALGLLAVANILAYNLLHLGATANEVLLRSGRYGGAGAVGLEGWPERFGALLRGCALALGGRVSEYVEPDALLTLPVVVSGALALSGLALLARRREWLPLLVIGSAVLVVSFLNGRVEPVVIRARHYAQLLPLGFALVAVSVVMLRVYVDRWAPPLVTGGVTLALVALLIVVPRFELEAYVAERLTRPEKNNLALLQVVEAVSRGSPDETVYLDDQLATLPTMSGGRMLTQLRYLFTLNRQEVDTVNVAQGPLPIGQRGTASRRLVLRAENVAVAAARYRLEPLPGDPGDGSPIRVFRAYRHRPE